MGGVCGGKQEGIELVTKQHENVHKPTDSFISVSIGKATNQTKPKVKKQTDH